MLGEWLRDVGVPEPTDEWGPVGLCFVGRLASAVLRVSLCSPGLLNSRPGRRAPRRGPIPSQCGGEASAPGRTRVRGPEGVGEEGPRVEEGLDLTVLMGRIMVLNPRTGIGSETKRTGHRCGGVPSDLSLMSRDLTDPFVSPSDTLEVEGNGPRTFGLWSLRSTSILRPG